MASTRSVRTGVVLLSLANMFPAVESDASWILLAIAAGAAATSWPLRRPDGATRLPAALMHLGVLAAMAFLVFEMFFDGPSVYVLDLAHFMILLCACKFFDLQKDRDIGLVAVIAFLVLVIGALVSGSILFAMAIGIDVTVGVWWLIEFHLKRENEAVLTRRRASLGGAASQFGSGAQVSSVDVSSGAPGDRQPRTARVVVFVASGLLALSAMLFVAVPRGWGRPFFGRFQGVAAAMTGFTDEVKLDDARLIESDAPVMRVVFSRGGEIIGGGDFEPYLRGATMDCYVEGRWQRTSEPSPGYKVHGDSPTQLTSMPHLFRPEDLIRQEVWLEQVGSYFFAMYPPVAFGSRDIGLVERDRVDLVLKPKAPVGQTAKYTVYSPAVLSPAAVEALDYQPSSARRRRDGRSSISRGVRRIARQLADPLGDPADPANHARIAEGIRAYLSGDDFEYTLNRGTGRPRDADPVEDFLFRSRRGHCEFFASAMTLMCQSLGMQARLVSGYAVGTYNSVGEFHQFRQKDAHAWVEVKLPDVGWTTFDPSPTRAAQILRTEGGLSEDLRRLTEYVQFKWSVFVVAFDSEIRDELVGQFGAWFRQLKEGGGGAGDTWRATKRFFWGPELLTLAQRFLYWLLLVLGVAFFLLLTRILWIVSLMIREYLPARAPAGAVMVRRPEAKFYDRLLLLLANKGHRKPPSLTPREFAARLTESHAELGEVGELTEWFYEAQYGLAGLTRQQKDQTREFLGRLRAESSFGSRPQRVSEPPRNPSTRSSFN